MERDAGAPWNGNHFVIEEMGPLDTKSYQIKSHQIKAVKPIKQFKKLKSPHPQPPFQALLGLIGIFQLFNLPKCVHNLVREPLFRTIPQHLGFLGSHLALCAVVPGRCWNARACCCTWSLTEVLYRASLGQHLVMFGHHFVMQLASTATCATCMFWVPSAKMFPTHFGRHICERSS